MLFPVRAVCCLICAFSPLVAQEPAPADPVTCNSTENTAATSMWLPANVSPNAYADVNYMARDIRLPLMDETTRAVFEGLSTARRTR